MCTPIGLCESGATSLIRVGRKDEGKTLVQMLALCGLHLVKRVCLNGTPTTEDAELHVNDLINVELDIDLHRAHHALLK